MNLTDNYIKTREKLFTTGGIKPQSKTVETSGPVKNVHYYEAGEGKPLIIIHGGGSHSLQAYPIFKDLAQKYHLFIPDRPGCGMTDSFDYEAAHLPEHAAEFIRSFMDAAGIEKASILASSMGGLFAISFALKYPKRVEKLVFVGHPTGLTRSIPFVLRLLGTKGINKLLLKISGAPTVKSARQLYGQLLVADVAKVSDAFLDNDVAAALLPGAGESFISLLENCMSLGGLKREYLMSSRMKDLQMPVRFIIGDQDKFDSLENLKTTAATMKNAKVEVVQGGGHILWLDKPKACNKQIIHCLENS